MSSFIPNSFQVANAFVDCILGDLSGTAVKCYLFIVRKTRGWQKESDFISISQFQENLNIKKECTVRKHLNELIAFGLIGKREVKGYPCEYFLTTPPPKNGLPPPPKNGPHINTIKNNINKYIVVDDENLIDGQEHDSGVGYSNDVCNRLPDGIGDVSGTSHLVVADATTTKQKTSNFENKKRFEALAKLFNTVFENCKAVKKVSLDMVEDLKTGKPVYTKTNEKRLKLIDYAWAFAKMRLKANMDENGLINGEKPGSKHILMWFEVYFNKCLNDGFINGKNTRTSHETWKAGFDYIMKAETIERLVLEG